MKVDEVLQMQMQEFCERLRRATAGRMAFVMSVGPDQEDVEVVATATRGDRSRSCSQHEFDAIMILISLCDGLLSARTGGTSRLMLKLDGEVHALPDRVEVCDFSEGEQHLAPYLKRSR